MPHAGQRHSEGTLPVQVQFKTDNNIDGNGMLEERVNAMLEQHLGRFFPQLTLLKVHLSDSNGAKGGGRDKHCAIEARMEHEDPLAATHADEDVAKAITGACGKLKSLLDTRIEKRRGH